MTIDFLYIFLLLSSYLFYLLVDQEDLLLAIIGYLH